jgi:hypothetical protein
MSGVFLSYAPADQMFARMLHERLAADGRKLARDGDSGSAPSRVHGAAEIRAAIVAADKFVFVISPEALDSAVCAGELATAVESGKQVVPLLHRPARDGQPVPPAVAELNWIFFDDDDRFEQAYSDLALTLDTDQAWARAHTRLLARAREWDVSRASPGGRGLLRGSDLRAAVDWLADAGDHRGTRPASVQIEYIAASRRRAAQVTLVRRSGLAVLAAASLTVAAVLVSGTVAARDRNAANTRCLTGTWRLISGYAYEGASAASRAKLTFAGGEETVEFSANGDFKAEQKNVALNGKGIRFIDNGSAHARYTVNGSHIIYAASSAAAYYAGYQGSALIGTAVNPLWSDGSEGFSCMGNSLTLLDTGADDSFTIRDLSGSSLFMRAVSEPTSRRLD